MKAPNPFTILYRGPLASCNYSCTYCPLTKRRENAADHEKDRQALQRFVAWVAAQDFSIAVFFTPWGEALIHSHYRQALIDLSSMPHVTKVAIQTNLSGPLNWVGNSVKTKLGIWATYHPVQVSRADFLAQCQILTRQGIRYSVGCVGVREQIIEIEELRRALPEKIYLWVNAYKHELPYYGAAEIQALSAVDPLFAFNNQRYPSQGHACNCGHTVVSVDGTGTLRNCHFDRTPLGNLYTDNLGKILQPHLCTQASCSCHIGYIHMPELGLDEVFGEGLLERIPKTYPRKLR